MVKAEGEEKITTDDPEEAVKELAMQKAQEVAGRVNTDVVIGADTVVAVRRRDHGKTKESGRCGSDDPPHSGTGS